jgi:hypothetical protein
VAAGRAEPATPAEAVELAQLCKQRFLRRYAVAARLYAGAFAADPGLAADLTAGHRYSAACYAALAAAGRDAELTTFGPEEWGHLTDTAHGWLRADLVARTTQAKDPVNAEAVRKALAHWRQDSDLAAVRDPAWLAAMPAPDRAKWEAFWADVDALLAAGPP